MISTILNRTVTLLLILLAIAGITLGAIFYLLIDSKPLVSREVQVTHEHIARVKSIFDTHRYQVRPGSTATATIKWEDLDTILNYLAHHLRHGRAQSKLHQQEGRI
ncbi:MAG: hypothetical protein WAT53_06410, partial [Nitrosomonas sp.]